VLIFVGMWVALGGLRGAWNNPAQAADAISRVPANVNVTVAGDVTQEPILEASGRLLVVDVHQVSVDGGTDWRPASGMLQVHANGPDDWFAPAYGDALQVTGKVVPVTGSAPADVLARMTASSVRIVARGGGSPLFARLFTLRVALAQAMQHALPEPEAALLIGILLGLKTPVLRARLALFTTTGTIHR
jgi:competence protein ComEC